MSTSRIAIVGAGLAGCECALALARKGHHVTLFEQRPLRSSPAHVTDLPAELVCSNSLRSDELTSGIGLLKQELRELQSPLMAVADAVRVPAGKALAVDREAFSLHVARLLDDAPNITLRRQAISSLDDPALTGDEAGPFERVVIAAGPLASDDLTASIASVIHEEGASQLYFYDAIAPIVAGDSIDMSVAFWGSRYEEPGEGDYINCPMNQDEYRAFYEALLAGDKVSAHGNEKELHFEGCMPIEALAARGDRTLTFGPMKPVGLTDPRTGRRPWAVLQLRPENANKTMFNLVGCQTKLTYGAQEQIFRLVPGLANVEFVRLGSMHRNTYVNAPRCLDPLLRLHSRPHIHLAGQLTGVEGYVESMASGCWAALCVHTLLTGSTLAPPPSVTALGALLQHIRTEARHFQPSNVNFGLMPEPDVSLKKKERKDWYAQRARSAFEAWKAEEKGTE